LVIGTGVTGRRDLGDRFAYHSGMSVVPLRWVLVRDPAGKFAPQAFLCTDEAVTPEQILAWFVQRWQVEVTFEEARAHLAWKRSGNGRGVRLPAPHRRYWGCIRW
jgi:hypothetical protein